MRILGGALIIVLVAIASAGFLDSQINTDYRDTDFDLLGISSPDTLERMSNSPDSHPGGNPGTPWSDDEITATRELSDDRCFPGVADAETSVSGMLVILDPGHGGEDLGTVDQQYGLTESELVLSIAWLLMDRLNGAGADVCMTRTGDYNVGLLDRAEFANQQQGNAFVSLHLNHLPDPGQNYTMTMWGSEAKDRYLAQVILSAMAVELAYPEYHDGDPNPMDPEVTRIEHLDSNMLRNAKMPAVLVEASFLSNSWESRAFRNGIQDGTRWREHQIADAVLLGLLEYFAAFNG